MARVYCKIPLNSPFSKGEGNLYPSSKERLIPLFKKEGLRKILLYQLLTNKIPQTFE
jgi:hypothetical protein